MTGQEIYQDLRLRIDQAYNTYLDPTKANRLLKNTLIKACEKKYMGLRTQKEFDEIRHMITTQRVIVPVRNRLQLKPYLVVSVTGAAPTLTVTTRLPHGLAATDIVVFSATGGLVTAPAFDNVNGFSVTAVLSETEFTITVAASAGAFAQNSASVRGSNIVPDYGHLFSLKARFLDPIQGLMPVRLQNAAPTPIIYLNNANNLRTGELISITGSSFATINEFWYIRKVRPLAIELYSDAAMTSPLPIQVSDLNVMGGVISRQYERYASTYFSDRKIDDLDQPDTDNVKLETADNSLKIYPDDRLCTRATVDYFKVPTVFIDVNDTVIDYTLIYPHKFLDSIMDQAAAYFGNPAKDRALNQDLAREIIENP